MILKRKFVSQFCIDFDFALIFLENFSDVCIFFSIFFELFLPDEATVPFVAVEAMDWAHVQDFVLVHDVAVMPVAVDANGRAYFVQRPVLLVATDHALVPNTENIPIGILILFFCRNEKEKRKRSRIFRCCCISI